MPPGLRIVKCNLVQLQTERKFVETNVPSWWKQTPKFQILAANFWANFWGRVMFGPQLPKQNFREKIKWKLKWFDKPVLIPVKVRQVTVDRAVGPQSKHSKYDSDFTRVPFRFQLQPNKQIRNAPQREQKRSLRTEISTAFTL